MKTFPITLQESYYLSSYVKHFVFEADSTHFPESTGFPFIAGQFITIHFEKDGKSLKRSYSIANAPQNNYRIEFAAGFVKDGPGTELLFALKPNDQLTISGPYGRLILKDQLPQRYILIATSTGITPYRSMIPELKKRLDTHPELNVLIIAGGQHPEDILYQNEWVAFANQYAPRVAFRAQLSRYEQEPLAEYQYRGRIQTAFPQLNLDPEKDEVYLCGNPNMVDESFEYLKNYDFPIQKIIREKYISR